jgi:uncharacterized membrane protein
MNPCPNYILYLYIYIYIYNSGLIYRYGIRISMYIWWYAILFIRRDVSSSGTRYWHLFPLRIYILFWKCIPLKLCMAHTRIPRGIECRLVGGVMILLYFRGRVKIIRLHVSRTNTGTRWKTYETRSMGTHTILII